MSARYVESLLRAVSPTSKLDLHNVLSSLNTATTLAAAAPLDHLYARIGAINGPFFPAGWGNLGVVNYEEDLQHLIQGPPSSIKLSWRLVERGSRDGTEYLLYEGTFRTPCLQRVYDALPPESRTGRVQLLMPARLQAFNPLRLQQEQQERLQGQVQDHPVHETASGPAACDQRQAFAGSDGPAVVVHLAATGDQTFGRRLRLGAPLLKDNVCSLVLESPFYGARRPAAQRGSKLLRVSDLLTLGWATIAESVNLLHWAREQGFGPMGMCGLSMGGVHASMTAGLYPGDVAVAPLLAPRSAAVAYCDGAMRAVMAWEPLLKEVDENNNQITQVVLSAGRAITLQLPAAPAASADAATGPSGAAGPAAAQSVALMREATYALADLETAGEKRHMAAASAASGAGSEGGGTGAAPSSSSSRSDGGGGGEGGRGSVDAGSDSSSSGGGAAAVLRRLPSLSIMDVYGALAGTALRVAGRATGNKDGQQQQPHGADLGRRPHGHADASAAAAGEVGGPFSGIIPEPPRPAVRHAASAPGPQHAHAHAHSQAGIHGGSTGGRPHPPPHGPDMPFPPDYAPSPHHFATEGADAPGSEAAGNSGGSGAGGGGGGTALGRRLLGDLGRAVKQLRAGDRRLDNPDTVMRLKRVLETYTDITRYPRPRRTDAAVIVSARDDAYVSAESVRQLHAYWPGSELRSVSGGHVSAFLMHQDAFRQAIRDSLTRVARPPPQQR